MRRRLFPSLVLLLLTGWFRVGPALAQPAEEIDFYCERTRLYRGDTLVVDFHSPHDNADLAISNADGQTMLISFKRRPQDKVDPVIPQGEFGKMKQVRLATDKARGSVLEPWVEGKAAAVLKQPQLVFTETGNYDLIVGQDLKSPNSEIDVCDLYYYDYPRGQRKRKSPAAAGAVQAPSRSRPTWGKILIAGGVCYDIDLPLASAELYDPVSNRFSHRRLKMKYRRSGAAAGAITTGPNAGKILIAGGHGNRYQELSSTELYDPATNTFQGGPNMRAGRVWPTATVIVSGLNAGKILMAGGQGTDTDGGGLMGLSSTELYDPMNNIFQPGPRMRTGRFEHTATTIVSGPNAGKVLLVGGLENYEHSLSSTELYDPVSNTIHPGPTMNVPRSGHTATVIVSGKNAGKILIAGGDDGRNGGIGTSPLASTEFYDPSSNTISSGPAMKTARKRHSATAVESGPNAGKILIAGGDNVECNADNCHGNDLSSTELYAPKTNAFDPGPAMNYGRSGHTATGVKYGPNGGKILISGGMYHSGQPLPTDLYDPLTNAFAPESRTSVRYGGCDDTISIQLPPPPPAPPSR